MTLSSKLPALDSNKQTFTHTHPALAPKQNTSQSERNEASRQIRREQFNDVNILYVVKI